MIQVRKRVLSLLGILIIVITAFWHGSFTEGEFIKGGLRLARIAIDVEKVKRVTTRIQRGDNGVSIAFSQDYMELSDTLKQLAASFPVAAKWTYIIQPSVADHAMLAVLTIDTIKGEPQTVPGYNYNIKPYPAMQEILRSDKETTVSGLVWDKIYKIWTRSGFIKMYDTEGTTAGILAVDIDAKPLIYRIQMTILIIVMYSAGLVMVIFYLAGLVSRKKKSRNRRK